MDPEIDEKKIVRYSLEKDTKTDLENSSKEDLKELVKSMISKQKKISDENQNFLQEIEKLQNVLIEKEKEYEELNEIQNMEINKLQKICKKLNKKVKDLQKNYQDTKNQQITNFPTSEKKLKMKLADESPDSIFSNHDDDYDFDKKWSCSEEECFTQNSEHFHFQFKKISSKIKNKIMHRIDVELKNNSSSEIVIEDIRITSAESIK